MKYISHRGNLAGPDEKENHPDYVSNALNLGYDVEIDVWHIAGEFFLGHDKPQYSISDSFLENEKFWCHAKNLHALEKMMSRNVHCFWHQEDDMVLTSKKFIWTYPGKDLSTKSIAVLPELVVDWDTSICYGICTDHMDQ
jgi:hypothetical protein